MENHVVLVVRFEKKAVRFSLPLELCKINYKIKSLKAICVMNVSTNNLCLIFLLKSFYCGYANK